METSSFLARKTWGQPNYLLVAVAGAFLLALAPYSAQRAIDSTANRAEDWLPDSYEESQDLAWFRENFLGEEFVLVSWDGCTLANTEKLDLLAKKLGGQFSTFAKEKGDVARTPRSPWYSRVVTGAGVIEELTRAPLSLSYDEALKRVEGVLVGPPQHAADGNSLGDTTRTTCLVAHLSPAAMRSNATMRAAIDHIADVAQTQCGIQRESLHLGGPPVDNVGLDIESQRSIAPMAALAGIAGVALCYWRLRSLKLTAVVFAVGAASAIVSVAVVFYFGVFEVLALGRQTPKFGTLDALLLTMPAIVYVLAVSGALHAVNCYRQARREFWLPGAAERAARMTWGPAALAALTMAAGLATLVVNDSLPIQRFGLFAAIGVLAAVGVLLFIVPVWLHRFPPSDATMERRAGSGRFARWARGAFSLAIDHRPAVLGCWAVTMVIVGLGVLRLQTSIHLMNPLDDDARLARDYAWLENHLGNLAPLEVIVTMPPERLRAASESAEQDGQQYRLTMLERVELVRDVQRRIADIPNISGVMSAASFGPPAPSPRRPADRTADYALAKSLEQHRPLLVASDFLQVERRPGAGPGTGRELWRISARAKAMPDESTGDIDYGATLGQLKDAIGPVLLAYQQRDCVTQALHEQSKSLAGARVCILFRAPGQASAPPAASQEAALATLLRHSGAAPRGVTYFNLATYDQPHRQDAMKDDAYRRAAIDALHQQDVVVLASASSDPAAKQLAASGVMVADVSDLPSVEETTAVTAIDGGGPRPIRAVITGQIPVIERTQRQLAESMKTAVFWGAIIMLGVMIVLLRSAVAGLAALASCAFPLVMTFGALGWAGVEIDLGVMMTASVALALAISGAIHYLTWLRRGMAAGLPRTVAAVDAYERSAEPMVQSAIIVGLGMLVFAFSTFTPLVQFGYLMIVMVTLALAANLVVLPALVASPIGQFFKSPAARRARSAGTTTASSAPPAPHIRRAATSSPATPTDAPRAPHVRAVISASDRHEVAHGPHSALHAKLQELRRAAGRESPGTAE